MYLVGDIGNTEVKIFLLNKNYILKKKLTIKTNKIKRSGLNNILSPLLSKINKLDKKFIL